MADPVLVVDAPQGSVSSPSGLLAVAATIEADRPVIYGVEVAPDPIGGHGLWGTPVCGPGDRVKEGGDVEASTLFPGTAVWAAHECSTVGQSESEATAASQRRFRAVEGADLEVFAAGVLADRAVASAADLSEAEAMFRAEGVVPVLHVRPSDVPGLIRSKHLVVSSGTVRTLLGSPVAIGSGYQTEFPVGTAYLTGPVTIYRNAQESYVAVDTETNVRLAVTERASALTWATQTVAVTITEEGSGGG